jgi:hypothetical protein
MYLSGIAAGNLRIGGFPQARRYSSRRAAIAYSWE